MADRYIDPELDTDMGGAMPEGQTGGQGKPASPAPRPVTEQTDPTKKLDIMSDGGEAIDALRKKQEEGTPAPADTKPTETPAPVDKGGKGDDGDLDAGDKGGEATKGAEGAEGGKGPEGRPSAIPADDDAAPKPDDTKDGIDSVELPEGASKKASEQWEALKAKAREEVAKEKARAEEAIKAREEQAKEIEELKKKAEQAPTDEQKKEIEELRKWRAAREVESAPELKSIDSKITANTDSLLAKLKEAGMVQSQIDDIRKIGIENVEWGPLKEKMSSSLRQFVDAKVLQQVNLSEERTAKYSELKSKGDEFIKQKTEAAQAEIAQRTQRFEGAEKHFRSQKGFEFLSEAEVPANATAEQKAAIEEGNKFAKQLNGYINEWKANIQDPAMQAELLFGGAMAYKFMRDLKNERAAFKAKTEELEAQLKEATEKFEKVKRASGAGRRSGNAPTPRVTPGSEIVDESGKIKDASSALDELAAGYQNR